MNVESNRPLSLQIEMNESLSLLSVLNAGNVFPCIKSLSIKNETERSFHDLTLAIHFEPNISSDKTFVFSSLNPGEKVILSPKELGSIIFSSFYFSQVQQTQNGSISFEVKDDGQTLVQETRSIKLLPYNQWGGTGTLRYSQLARFVMPKLPGVKEIVLKASELLLKEKQQNLDGYQSDPNGIRDQVNAIFNVIRSCQIAYMNPPSNLESEGQEIRIPEETLRNRAGTCIDMAVLLASCLENISLHPIIFVVEGHAYAGCFLNEEESLRNEVDASYGRIYGLIQSKRILVVECTAMCLSGQNTTFDQALMEASSKTLNNEMTLNAVDVRLCRQTGIAPLPLSFDPIQGKLIFDASSQDTLNSTIEFGPDAPLQATKKNETRFDVWEKELLDMNMSNPLLNFRLRGSTINFFNVDTYHMHERLRSTQRLSIVEYPLTREIPKTLSDILAINENKLFARESNQLFDEGKIMAISRGFPLTNSLKLLYRKSRDNFEETGANPLYLCVGLLKYFQPEEINLGNFKLSPVILIPVELKKPHGTSFYTLDLKEEDWVINQTLLEYLRRTFHLDISKLLAVENREDGSIDIPGVLDYLTKMISDQDHWILYRNYVGLGIFDFSTYVMWDSLHRHRFLYENNRIISALATGSNSKLDTLDFTPFDEAKLCVPLTADSSQLTAVHNSALGKSFILFGPPGTGKSQTIVNTICHLLFLGKQVLFVSEKKAALDVVYNRMRQLGLESFCLSLHSSEVRKGSILNQFARSFETATKFGKPIDYEEKFKEIQETKKKLSSIFDHFNTPKDYFISINDAFIQYEANKGYRKGISYEDKLLRSLNKAKMGEIKSAFDEILFVEEKSHITYLNNPLRPLQGDRYGLGAKEKISAFLDSLKKSKERLVHALSDLWSQDLPYGALSFKDLSCLADIIKTIHDREGLLTNTIGKGLLTSNEGRINTFLNKIKNFQGEDLALALEIIDPSKISYEDFCKGQREYSNKRRLFGIIPNIFASFYAKKFFKPFSKRKIKFSEIDTAFSKGEELLDLYGSIKKEEAFIKSLFTNDVYQGEGTPHQKLAECFTMNLRIENLLNTVQDIPARNAIAAVIRSTKPYQLKPFLMAFEDFTNKLKEGQEEIVLSPHILLGDHAWSSTFDSNVLDMSASLGSLPIWANQMSAIHKAENQGLKELMRSYRKGEVPSKCLWNTFLADTGYEMAVSQIKSLNLEGFSGLTEEGMRKKYHDLYQEFRALSLAELKAKLSYEIPSPNNSGKLFGELGFLMRNISSGGRGQTIRSLIANASNLIRTLCPCFLMSPMTVANFLDEKSSFDCVIFDEASQIPTAEALGSILRGKSLIVCGDLKQLPPTTFFKSTEDNENGDLSSLPSVLDDCKAILMPEIELKWHYRSRNESLIAFSNQEFYDSSLYTFPSFDDSISMVKYNYTKSTYDRGKTRTNEAEANAIVNEVLKLKTSEATKTFSIGIVTFSAPQKNLIEDLMDDMLEKYSSVKEENEKSIEPIFIKNIENVQGDERDIIIFSIGYGLDKEGKLSYNFGPLNGDKGYRRLNVAITRSRIQMLVFTNIDPTQVPIEKIDNMGAQYLMRFLQYAKEGRGSLLKNNNSPSLSQTIVVDSIADSLTSLGYVVSKNVGDSKFRIHLALGAPDDSQRYVLGIMIEGGKNNDYSLVDKLEIQPNVLRSLGWHLMRVYLIDWINSPEVVLQEIEKEYERALDDAKSPLDSSFSVESNSVVFTRPIRTATPSKKDAFIKDYEASYFGIKSTDYYHADKIKAYMESLIEVESPLSEKVLYERIARIFSISRMGSTMRKQYDEALRSLHPQTTRNPDGTLFYWAKRRNPLKYAIFRMNSKSGERDFTDIPKEELAVLCHDLLLKQYSMTKDELLMSIKDFLKYNPRSPKNITLLEQEVEWAIANRPDLISMDENQKLSAKDKIASNDKESASDDMEMGD